MRDGKQRGKPRCLWSTKIDENGNRCTTLTNTCIESLLLLFDFT